MAKRSFIHFCLILLFAFTQMDIITHEISHFSTDFQQSQSDKKTQHTPCEKCVGYANAVANGLANSFSVSILPQIHVFAVYRFASFFSTTRVAYLARAPPRFTTA